MGRLQKFLLAVGLLFSLQLAALAKTYSYDNAKVQFQVPDDFSVKMRGKVLTVVSPSKSLSMIFDSLAGDSIEQVGPRINKEVARYVKNLKFTERPQSITINGLSGRSLTGTGTIQSIPYKVNYTALRTESNRIFFVVSLVNANATTEAAPVVQGILTSIKPV